MQRFQMLAVVIAISLLFSCASPSEKRIASNQKSLKSEYKIALADEKQRWTAELGKLSTHYNVSNNCLIIGAITDTGVVLQTGSKLMLDGFSQGDRVISVNGKRLSGKKFHRFLQQFAGVETLSLEVERAGQSLDITTECSDDGKIYYKDVTKLYKAALKNDWSTCKKLAISLNELTGNASPNLFYEYARCSIMELGGNGFPANRNSALNHFQVLKLLFKQIPYDVEKQVDIETLVRGTTEWLSQIGSSDLSGRASKLYAQAIQQRDSRISEVENVKTKTKQPIAKAPNSSQGTCFAISDDGILITNHHVIDGMKLLNVRFEDGKTYTAQVLRSSKATDLAILKISRHAATHLPLYNSSQIKLGDEVFTLGYPAAGILGLDIKYTDGVISALAGIGGEASYVQTTVPIQPGNSGGPLINKAGEVVGVTTASAKEDIFYQNTGALPQNINYAIKSNYINSIAKTKSTLGPLSTKSEAIERAKSSVCLVVGES